MGIVNRRIPTGYKGLAPIVVIQSLVSSASCGACVLCVAYAQTLIANRRLVQCFYWKAHRKGPARDQLDMSGVADARDLWTRKWSTASSVVLPRQPRILDMAAISPTRSIRTRYLQVPMPPMS